jgi:hypothetical protein
MSDDFWGLSDGKDVKDEIKDGSYDTGAGGFTLIPKETEVLALAEEVKWAKKEEDTSKHIAIRWLVIAPESLKNRKVFQKIRVKEADSNTPPEKRQQKVDNAKRMFGAIDFNCGGKLLAARREPTDEDLMQHIANKMMVLKMGVVKMGDGSHMNFVSAVGPKDKPPTSDAEVEAAQKRPEFQSMRSGASTGGGGTGRRDLDDEIPFAPQFL